MSQLLPVACFVNRRGCLGDPRESPSPGDHRKPPFDIPTKQLPGREVESN